jgi:hypothetical protein
LPPEFFYQAQRFTGLRTDLSILIVGDAHQNEGSALLPAQGQDALGIQLAGLMLQHLERPSDRTGWIADCKADADIPGVYG